MESVTVTNTSSGNPLGLPHELSSGGRIAWHDHDRYLCVLNCMPRRYEEETQTNVFFPIINSEIYYTSHTKRKRTVVYSCTDNYF